MRFHSLSYQMLTPESDGRVFGELILSHVRDDTPGSATGYILHIAYCLVYDSDGMSFDNNMVRVHGSPAPTSHYMIDMVAIYDGSDPSEYFFSSGLKSIPQS